MKPTVYIKLADGTIDDSVFVDGIVTNILDLEVNHDRFGGDLGGWIELAGGHNDASAIGSGRKIEVWHKTYDDDGELILDDDDEPVLELYWSGIVTTMVRNISGRRHRYTIEGMWQRLKYMPALSRACYGSDVTGAPNTASAIAIDLLTNYIANATFWPDTPFSADTSQIQTTAETIASFTVDDGADIQQVLENLMYQGTVDGLDVWVGFDANGKLYLRSIPEPVDEEEDGDETDQVTITAGVNALSGEETVTPEDPENSITIIGCVNAATGFVSKKIFEDSGSIDVYGRGRRQNKIMPFIFRYEDMLRAAGIYFLKFAKQAADEEDEAEEIPSEVSSLQRGWAFDHEEASVRPWMGMARYLIPDRDVDKRFPISSVCVRYGARYEVVLGLGDTSRASSTIAPTEAGNGLADAFGGLGDGFYNLLPQADDTTEPYAGAPSFDSTLKSGVSGGPDGTVLAIWSDPSTVAPGDRLKLRCLIANGGGTIDPPEGVDAVRLVYRHVTDAGTLISFESEAAVKSTTAILPTGFELWESDPGVGVSSGYLVPTLSTSGKVYFGAAVRKPDSYSGEAQYFWFPADVENHYDEVASARIIESAASSVSETVIAVMGSYLQPGT